MDRLCFGRHGGGAFVRADDGGKLDLCGCVGGERFGGKDTRKPGHVLCSPSFYRDVELASELVISFFNERVKVRPELHVHRH